MTVAGATEELSCCRVTSSTYDGTDCGRDEIVIKSLLCAPDLSLDKTYDQLIKLINSKVLSFMAPEIHTKFNQITNKLYAMSSFPERYAGFHICRNIPLPSEDGQNKARCGIYSANFKPAASYLGTIGFDSSCNLGCYSVT